MPKINAIVKVEKKKEGVVDKYTEWEGMIDGYEVKTFHGVVTIEGKEIDYSGDENRINNVILTLLRKGEIDNKSVGLDKDEMAEIIYNTVYQDKKPKQEIGARLECLGLAQVLKDSEDKIIVEVKEK